MSAVIKPSWIITAFLGKKTKYLKHLKGLLIARICAYKLSTTFSFSICHSEFESNSLALNPQLLVSYFWPLTRMHSECWLDWLVFIPVIMVCFSTFRIKLTLLKYTDQHWCLLYMSYLVKPFLFVSFLLLLFSFSFSSLEINWKCCLVPDRWSPTDTNLLALKTLISSLALPGTWQAVSPRTVTFHALVQHLRRYFSWLWGVQI